MGARGRKSKAQLTAVKTSSVESVDRPTPPRELTAEQAREWKEVIAELPADRISKDRQGLLVAYCRHRVTSRRVAEWIEGAEQQGELDLSDYEKLLRMQERESRILSSLAVRLGFAFSASYDKLPSRRTPKSRPWEFDPSESG